jgi:uncharacterized protein (TIGR03067 family)
MSGYKGFEAGKNGVFIVLPSGRRNCWKHYRWYTPARGGRENYGNWSFLKDGATPGNGVVENWFELLESWFGAADDKAGVKAAPGAKEELDRLQGEWTMVSLEQRGEKAGDEAVRGFKLTIKGDRWTVTSSEGKRQPTQMTITIDPSRDPKTIDLTARVRNREIVFPGIYKLVGDTLTLRRATETGDVERPREFTTTAEEGMLAVWKRAKE